MKHLALGWACNLNDLLVKFPIEKYKSLIKNFRTKIERISKVKRVFKTGLQIILKDVVENNVTFKLPNYTYRGGEIHFEPIEGQGFINLRKAGKFSGIDFLESNFTGYQLYLYLHGKQDDFLHRRKFPIHLGSEYKKRIEELVNQGKVYG